MLIPTVIQKTSNGERAYDLFSRLMNDRILFCTGQVEDNMANILVGQLLFLNNESKEKPINLYINSPGGSVTSGLGIANTMNLIDAPVHTFCFGQACSMGSYLLAMGEPGHRYSLKDSSIMIHQPSGGFRGQETDIQIQAAEIGKLKTKLTKDYALRANGKKSLEEFMNAMERDKWLSPEEALEWGIIDSICEKKTP